ncbi:MAG: hypothetical protein JJU12_06925 [Chlamydiales bacterium]|nr:hypothetical protein [Chlamydiales bacterium]
MSVELPKEVLAHCFGFFDLLTLSRAAQVSGKWRLIANDSWKLRMHEAKILTKEAYLTYTGYFTLKSCAHIQPTELQGKLKDRAYGTTAIQIQDGYLWRGDESGNLECWKLSTLSKIERFRGHFSPVTSIASFGNYLYTSGCGDFEVRRWKVPFFDNLTFPNEVRFAGSNPTTIFFYDKKSAYAISLATRKRETYSLPENLSCLYFFEGGGYAGYKNGKVDFFPECNSWPTSFKAHSGWVTALTVQGDALYSGGEDAKVRVWNRKTFDFVQEISANDLVTAIQVYDETMVTIEGPFSCCGGGRITIREYSAKPHLNLIKIVDRFIRQSFRDLIGFCY